MSDKNSKPVPLNGVRKGKKKKAPNKEKNPLANVSAKQLSNIQVQQLNGIFNNTNQSLQVLQEIRQFMGLLADMLYETLSEEQQLKFRPIEEVTDENEGQQPDENCEDCDKEKEN